MVQVPSQIVIQAGDGQTADPGLPVPIRPSVVVQDATGRAVPNVSVTFSVDSGGGAVTGGTITTGADGIATVGEWRLGAAEGRNLLRASVGSVTPVRFVAIGRVLLVTLIDNAPVPVTGGLLRISKPGDPNDGLELGVRPRSYPTETRWTISAARSISIPLPAGAFQVGPAVRVENGMGYADSVMTLSIPARAGADTALAAFYYDSTTKWLEAIPIAARTATHVTIGTRHFSTSAVWQPSAAAGVLGRAAAGSVPFGSVVVVVIGVVPGVLRSQITTSFVPGVDDWEFTNYGSFLSPNGYCAGWSITSMYYHYRHRQALGPLSGKFGLLTNPFPDDNPQGIRFASVVQESIDWNSSFKFLTQLDSLAVGQAVDPDVVHYHSMVVSLFATRRPQYMAVSNDTLAHAVVVHEANGGDLLFVDPNLPGSTRLVSNVSGLFQPIQFSANAGSSPDALTRFRLVGVSAMMSMAKLDVEFARVPAGTAGDGVFPATSLEVWNRLLGAWEPLVDGIVVPSDTIFVRADCPTCPIPINPATPADKRQGVSLVDALGSPLATGRPTAQYVQRPGSARIGITTEALQRKSPTATAWKYVNFNWLLVTSVVGQVQPRQLRIGKDSTVQFEAVIQGAVITSGFHRWRFTQGGITDTVTVSGASTVNYQFTRDGRYAVAVEVLSKGRPVLRDSTTVDVVSPPAWKFTTVTVAYSVVQPGPLLANPAQQICYACWQRDSLMWERIRTGQSEGGLLHLGQDSTITGVLGVKGVYVIEGSNITLPRMSTAFDFRVTTLSGVPPAAGQITSHALVHVKLSAGVSTADPTLNEGYAEAGSTTSGRIDGLVWGPANPTIGFPFNLRQAAVRFNGDVVTGTLTYMYRMYAGGTVGVENRRSAATVTFVAVRLR